MNENEIQLNEDMLLWVKDRTLKRPQARDMSMWARRTACGTTFCIAGDICLLSGLEPVFNADGDSASFVDAHGTLYSAADFAAKILGLPVEKTSVLFYASLWPTVFRERLFAAMSAEERAEVTADRIDYFIQTRQ